MFVVDTNVFSNAFKHIKFKSFPTFWIGFEDLLEKGSIISVREVYRELETFFITTKVDNNDEVTKWLKRNKHHFLTPANKDCIEVQKIFKNKHFRQLIKRQSLLYGNPEADAFVVAKAIVEDATVVTNEKAKQNGAKIPNVCIDFGVNYINDNEFFKYINEHFDKNLKDKYYL